MGALCASCDCRHVFYCEQLPHNFLSTKVLNSCFVVLFVVWWLWPQLKRIRLVVQKTYQCSSILNFHERVLSTDYNMQASQLYENSISNVQFGGNFKIINCCNNHTVITTLKFVCYVRIALACHLRRDHC